VSDEREAPPDDGAEPGMHKEQIAISDDRYLIYYTWPQREQGDGPSAAASRNA